MENLEKDSSQDSSTNEPHLIPIGHGGIKVFRCKICNQRFRDMQHFSSNPQSCDMPVCQAARKKYREDQANQLVQQAMAKMKQEDFFEATKKDVPDYGRSFKTYFPVRDFLKNSKENRYYREVPAAVAEHFQ